MTIDHFATVCFGLAILHTFAVGYVRTAARRYPRHDVRHRILHVLGEVELTFGIWALVFLTAHAVARTVPETFAFATGLSFNEPVFVFVTMTVCAARPVLHLANALIERAARALPLRRSVALYAATLTLGPLAGSFVTEPAAMTVTALMLLGRFFTRGVSERLKYQTLGLLFVNVSIGGTLTPFAAPPILMVAGRWGWDLRFTILNFGWRAALAVVTSTVIVTRLNYRELAGLPEYSSDDTARGAAADVFIPWWLTGVHLILLAGIVAGAHHPLVYGALFCLFVGLVRVSRVHQAPLDLRGGALVGLFLAGLIVLGPGQRWWLEPALAALGPAALYIGAMALTGITDNAALTYLGSTIPSLGEAARYALVAGAVVGGGLTVIANAPNPAGYGILYEAFGANGIRPLALLRAAVLPTAVAAIYFWIDV